FSTGVHGAASANDDDTGFWTHLIGKDFEKLDKSFQAYAVMPEVSKTYFYDDPPALIWYVEDDLKAPPKELVSSRPIQEQGNWCAQEIYAYHYADDITTDYLFKGNYDNPDQIGNDWLYLRDGLVEPTRLKKNSIFWIRTNDS